MELLQFVFDLFVNLDAHLAEAANQYGAWIYAILFLVLFAETGLVVTPFLPGDSLLLTAGVLAAANTLDIWLVLGICMLGGIIGDSTNYWIGRKLGTRICESGRLVKREYIDSTAAFFERHGGKTVTIARFFPIIRTFAPFMAGIGHMSYARFVTFSVAGTFFWVGLFAGGGFLFGQIPGVTENLELAIMFVLSLTLIPAVYHFVQSRREARAKALAAKEPVAEAEPCDEYEEIRHAVDVAEHRTSAEQDAAVEEHA